MPLRGMEPVGVARYRLRAKRLSGDRSSNPLTFHPVSQAIGIPFQIVTRAKQRSRHLLTFNSELLQLTGYSSQWVEATTDNDY